MYISPIKKILFKKRINKQKAVAQPHVVVHSPHADAAPSSPVPQVEAGLAPSPRTVHWYDRLVKFFTEG